MAVAKATDAAATPPANRPRLLLPAEEAPVRSSSGIVEAEALAEGMTGAAEAEGRGSTTSGSTGEHTMLMLPELPPAGPCGKHLQKEGRKGS